MSSKKKLVYLGLGIAMLFFLVLLVTYVAAQYYQGSTPLPGGLHERLDPASTVAMPVDISQLSDQINILIVGHGGPGHAGGNLADVMMVLHIKPSNGTFSLISIPRDLYVNELGVSGKINTAYTKSGEILKQAVSRVTGLPVTNYLAVDFVGFQRAIHQIGGIDVEVTETLDDLWYPITGEELNPCDFTPEEIAELTNALSGFELEKQFECRYEHLHVEPGTVSMEGGDALKFVRSRHSSSDFSRSKRVQQVIAGIVKKLITLNTLDNIPGFFEEISTHVKSDIDLDSLAQITPILQSIPQLKIITVSLTTENVLTATGANLIPNAGEGNWQQIHDYIQQQIASE